jgi:dienelactone hydrolase
LPVQLWYPAVESARSQADAGRPVLDFEPPGKRRNQLRQLTQAAGAIYSQRTMHAADAPAVLEQSGQFPLVLISHCNDCTRFTYFELAERLAARGFVVAAPDHVDNTLYNYVEGNSVGVDLNDFLDTRRLDMKALADALLDANASAIPADLRGKIDPERIGMAGHSYGAITTAYAATVDTRIRAVAFLAMTVSLGDNLPALGDELAQRVKVMPFSKPALFLLETEDGINLFGLDTLIRQNYNDYPKETWLVTMKDGGHYSVTNICGIDFGYSNGCGTGIRTSQFLAPFAYLDIDKATALTAQLVTTYFEQQLNGSSTETLEAITAGQPGILTLEHRRP